MFSLLQSKGIIYGIVISLGLGAAYYSLYTWHIKPINTLEDANFKQKEVIRSQAITINNLGVQIQTLIEENKVTGFYEYFKGVADEQNNTIISDDYIF